MESVSDKICVLVVEDDELDRLIIGKALKGTTLCSEIVFAEDAEGALNAMEKKNYDCIFLDYNLPGANGLQLLKKMRESGINTPVIIITSQGDDRVAVELMKSGAADYIPKTLLTTEGTTQSLRHLFRLHETEAEKNHLQTENKSMLNLIKKIAEHVNTIMFSINETGYITMMEGKDVSFLEKDASRFIEKEISTLEGKLPFSKHGFRESLAGNDVKEIIERSENLYEVFYFPVRNHSGEITGVSGFAINLTAGKTRRDIYLSNKNQSVNENYLPAN
jgi:FixJ family two-component response regulator